MRGFALLGFSSLASHKGAFHQKPNSIENIFEKPVSPDDALFGRRKALQCIFLGGAVAASPVAAYALDMDAFMNSEVRLKGFRGRSHTCSHT
jgi:hypothetical protein